MRAKNLSPELLSAKLKDRFGREVKAAQIRAWVAESRHRWRLPADLVPHICEVLGDDSLQRLLLTGKQRDALELGQSSRRVASLLRKVAARR